MPRGFRKAAKGCADDGSPNQKLARRRRGRGYLEDLLDMPLDILYEVLAYLHPMDLLNLSRTNKPFRALLMSKGSAQTWRVSRCNVDRLPPCPKDLSEPAYANLMFDAHCHSCLGKNCHTVFLECRLRLCKKCTKKLEANYPFTITQMVDSISNDEIREIDVLDILPIMDVKGFETLAYGPDLEQMLEEMSKFTEAGELLAYLVAKQSRLYEIRETVDDLEMWFERARQSRIGELERLRDERQDAIVQKLKELGWQDELDYIETHASVYEIRTMPEVRKAQALTPRIWKNIEETILIRMQLIRTERRERLRKIAIRDRLRKVDEAMHKIIHRFSPHTPFPLEVALNIPEIRALVEPDDVDCDTEHLDILLTQLLPQYCQKRLEGAQQFFRDLLKIDLTVSEDIDPLSLAVGTFFSCTYCNAREDFPAIVGHSCGRRMHASEPADEFKQFANNSLAYPQVTWQASGFRTEVEKLIHFVRAYGLDPHTATADDMDQCEARLLCTAHVPNPGLAIHTWRSAFAFTTSHCEVIRCPQVAANAARQLEPANEKFCARMNREGVSLWRCARCSSRVRPTWFMIINHLKDSHDITEAQDDDYIDMTRHLACPHPVHLVPHQLEHSSHELDLATQARLKAGVAGYFDFACLDNGNNDENDEQGGRSCR